MKSMFIILLLFAAFASTAQPRTQEWTPKQEFEEDLAAGSLRIYILGGIAARPKEGDDGFQNMLSGFMTSDASRRETLAFTMSITYWFLNTFPESLATNGKLIYERT
ncbi:hypothetical protein [uncultured Flavobacterium sp.]|uniref:hypothetical protein n=1 Tax=uncultured Flavobacterium sp. TaxID=165435 RepID=UPI0025D0ADCA|nr:hypothetical protein [uncultured Flavobacterium sp.]